MSKMNLLGSANEKDLALKKAEKMKAKTEEVRRVNQILNESTFHHKKHMQITKRNQHNNVNL
jgi:hypothetical protein